jgi:mannan endo-1,4-beta-mannosidase
LIVQWANATAGEILLNAGNNTITFVDDWLVAQPSTLPDDYILIKPRGWYYIDCLYITPAPAPPPHKVTNKLVTPNPLSVTQALFDKLLSKYGSGEIFSGQADPTGVAWLEANIGATPAIIGLDMIDYSPTRVVSQIFTYLQGSENFFANNI